MCYEKLFETATKRFYKLQKYVSIGKFGPIKPTKYVLVSDSVLLHERLVFAFYFNPGHDEHDFTNGTMHFITVNKVHVMGELASTVPSRIPIPLPSDNELIQKLFALNVT